MKAIYIAIPVIAIASLLVGLGVGAFINNENTQTTSQGINYRGYVVTQVTRANGAIEPAYFSKFDPLTTMGSQLIKGALNGSSYLNLTNITLANCTGAFALTDKELCGGGVDPYVDDGAASATAIACSMGPLDNNATMTSFAGTPGAWNLTYQWTSTCGNVVVNATGLYNQTLGTNGLVAEVNFTTVTLQANDKLNVTWGLQILTPTV